MPTAPAGFRRAWRVSQVSVAWALFAASAATLLGLATRSALVVAFGAVGIVDALGSAALARHFRHGLRSGELSVARERRAHAIVTGGLLAVGTGAVAIGTFHLLHGETSEPSSLTVMLALVSLGVLVILARQKRMLAVRVGSSALHADSHMSAVGAAQSAVTVVGAATALLDIAWADPLGAMVVGAGAMTVGISNRRRGGRSADHLDGD
jgi:hypothetical protein